MDYAYCYQHLELFFELCVMYVQMQIAVSQALLIFQKRFPDAVHSSGR